MPRATKPEEKTVHLAFCCDRNVADGLAAVIASASHHLKKSSALHVHVIDCGLGKDVQDALTHALAKHRPNVRLEFIPLSQERLKPFPRPAALSHVTPAAFGRLFLHELLPDVSRVLYLDCDLLVTANLAELFATRLEGHPLAAAIDTVIPTIGHERESLVANVPGLRPELPYFNSGVLLLDLEKLRALDATARYHEALRLVEARYADQSVLNAVFHGQWKILPAFWNRQTLLGSGFSIFPDRSHALWHFSSKLKPWHFQRRGARGLVGQWFAESEAIGWKRLSMPTTQSTAPFAKDVIKRGRSWMARQKNDRAGAPPEQPPR